MDAATDAPTTSDRAGGGSAGVGSASGGDGGAVGSDRAERFAREHPALVKFGRVGWVAKGFVYALTGLLALAIAWPSADASGNGDASSAEASQTGAIARIAEHSAGRAVLVVLAVGLVVYAAWRVMTVLLPADNDLKAWLARVGYVVSAGVYLALAWTAVTFVRRPGSSAEGEDSRVESFTSELMANTAGRIAVFAIGAVLVIIAAVFMHKAVTASFETQLTGGGVGPLSHRGLVVLGRVGWAGRSAMMAVIGFFLARAAVRFDTDDAQGLDGSLRNAAESDVGTVLVVVVGVGLVVYGAFCVLSAPRQRLVGVDA